MRRQIVLTFSLARSTSSLRLRPMTTTHFARFTSSFSSSNFNHNSGSNPNPNPNPNSFQIFCDLDGVLCDFDKKVRSLFDGLSPDMIPPNSLWPKLARTKPGFYAALDFTPDGEELWKSLAPLQPTILTGVPFGGWAELQKLFWCTQNLQSKCVLLNKAAPHSAHALSNLNNEIEELEVREKLIQDEFVMKVITCWSKNKWLESGEGKILIDDREDLGVKWVEKGGTFVHHTSTEATLQALVALGVDLDSGGGIAGESVTGVIWPNEGAGDNAFPQITLYTKKDCTLCDKVVEGLRSVKEEEQCNFGLNAVDITDEENEAWYSKYKFDIPVIHCDGEYWFKHRLPERDLLKVCLRGGEWEKIGSDPDALKMEKKA